MDIDLKNVGADASGELSMTLTTESEYVDILSGEATATALNPDEIITVEGFQFSVAENVPDNTKAQFFLDVTDGTETWQAKFSITLHAPVVALNSIDDQNSAVTFTFTNNGSAPFYGGTFNLYSSSSALEFEETNVTFENTVEPGEIYTISTQYTIDESTQTGTTFEVAYDFVSGLQIVQGTFTITYGNIVEDFESGQFGDGWTFSSTYPWTIAAEGRDGYCAKSANAGVTSSEGWCQLTVDVLASGDLSFWYKVSSEQSYDKLHFYMDGQEIEVWSGNMDWSEFTQPVSTGTHTFKWSYTKDYSVNNGSDCAWIDNIKFPPVDVISFIDPVSDLQATVTGMTVDLTWIGSTDADSYVITRDDETIATVTETAYSEYVDEGVYKYSVFSKKGDALSQPVSVIVMVEYDANGEAHETVISVYPNPAKNMLNIVAGDSEFEFSLYNGMGQEMIHGTAQGIQQINVSGMAKGIYFLQLTSGTQVSTQKIVIE